MKFRESGMPNEEMWDAFFNPEAILLKLGLEQECDLLIDVGCGYGTFLLPTATHIKGKVIGLDIDQNMVDLCTEKVNKSGRDNIDVWKRDIFADGYGFDKETVHSVFLFNLLNCEEPMKLLRETHRVLKTNGYLYVIHWNYDETTPRGPSMDIRPKPEQIIDWASGQKFVFEKQVDVEKHHYGLVFRK